jgi:hypothetical protein
MRTTLDIDETLLREAQLRFPRGTPKTVVLEEGLRRLIDHSTAAPEGAGVVSRRPPLDAGRSDPRVDQLVRDGLLRPATMTGPPPSVGGFTLSQLLADLDADRADS